jgi:hypothetical protein
MTKEEWGEIQKDLSWTGAAVRLECDGYKLTIRRERYKELRDCYFVYVDGRWLGEWNDSDCEERRRFARLVSCLVHKPKERAKLKKTPPKVRQRLGPYFDPDRKFTFYLPLWMSFQSLKRHFIKNNKEIKLIKELPETATASTAKGA